MSFVTLNPVPPQYCCDQIGEALGRCWTWIVSGWHGSVDKVFQAVDGVAFGFFRVVGCFAPKWALKMEAGYGYLATWYARHTAASAQKVSEAQITDLERVNRGLNKVVVQRTGDWAALQAAHAQGSSERSRLSAERDGDIRARELMQGQHEQMELSSAQISERVTALAEQSREAEKRLQEMITSQAPVLAENGLLADALTNARLEIMRLQLGMRSLVYERDFALTLVKTVRGIEYNGN